MSDTDKPEDPGRVYIDCPECGHSHGVVWPMRNPDSVVITCIETCRAELRVTRDGEVAVDE